MPDPNWHSIFFFLFALLACGFAVAVVVTSNIVRMAFYLTLSLGATAGLFILAGAEFVGAMQLMIYVGGTLVLLVFGVMLTAQQRFIEIKTSGGDWVLAIVAGGALMALLAISAFSSDQWSKPHEGVALESQLELDRAAVEKEFRAVVGTDEALPSLAVSEIERRKLAEESLDAHVTTRIGSALIGVRVEPENLAAESDVLSKELASLQSETAANVEELDKLNTELDSLGKEIEELSKAKDSDERRQEIEAQLLKTASRRYELGIAQAEIKAREAAISARLPQIEKASSGVFSGYLLMFEVVAIHLLVVLVGAAYLARTRKVAGAKQA